MPRMSFSPQLDSDGLQADVMRFMAIIAFCLIAILALVKQLEPEADLQPVKQKETLLELETVPASVTKPPMARVPVATKVLPSDGKVTNLQARIEQRDESGMDASSTRSALALRFVSDAAFMALIAGGTIRVYASTPSGYVALGPDFEVHLETPRGSVYELLPESVPGKVRSVLAKGSAAQFLVSLSERARRFIEKKLADPSVVRSGGALIIDARGGVTHEN